LVEDSTHVMPRLKALFRARGIRTPGKDVYEVTKHADSLRQLSNEGVRFRARTLYAELAVLQELRPEAKQTMLREARRDPAWTTLRSIPFLGPVRVALLLAVLHVNRLPKFPPFRHVKFPPMSV
jgi:hypothetical protein